MHAIPTNKLDTVAKKTCNTFAGLFSYTYFYYFTSLARNRRREPAN